MTDKIDMTNADTIAMSGRFHLAAWNVDALKITQPEWDTLPRAERHELLRSPSTYPAAPFFEIEAGNMTVDGLLEELARGMDPGQVVDVSASHLALGDDDSVAPSSSNESLNNEVYRTQVGDSAPDGRDLVTSTFISQNEMNGEAIREIGLTTGDASSDPTLLTHAVLADADQIDQKTSEMVVTIDYVIEFRNIS